MNIETKNTILSLWGEKNAACSTLTVVRNFRILSVTCKTYFGFLLNLFRACFIHGPLKCSVTGRACFNWHSRGPPCLCQGPDPLSALFFLYDRQQFFFFLAGCTASWEVGCSALESGTFSSSSPRQPTTGCSTATPAITCTRACGGTAFPGNAWHTQTVLVRIAVCIP